MTLDTTAARLEGLLERATKGDWHHFQSTQYGVVVDNMVLDDDDSPIVECVTTEDDAKLIMAMKNALPALLSERRALMEECERLREALAPLANSLHEYLYTGSDNMGFSIMIQNWKRDVALARAVLTANGGEHD